MERAEIFLGNTDLVDTDTTIQNFRQKKLEAARQCKREGIKCGIYWASTVYALRQIAPFFTKLKKATFIGNTVTFATNFVGMCVLYGPYCSSNANKIINAEEAARKEELNNLKDTFSMDFNTSFQSSLQPYSNGPDTGFSHVSVSYEPNISDNLVTENEEEKEKEKVKPKVYTTYADLRRQHRAANRAKNAELESSNPLARSVRDPPPEKEKKNQYGDSMD